MVDEVPVRAADEADVRLEDEYAAAGLEQGKRNAQLLKNGLSRCQMLEVVAEESQVEGPRRQHVGQLESAGSNEMDIRRQRRRDVTNVGRPAFGGVDVPYEVAEVASDVDHASPTRNVPLQETAQLTPDGFLARLVRLVEAELVYLFEDDRRRVVCLPARLRLFFH